ncbi:taurine dioxygenase [Parasphingorhabdus marina DSM 22363]|uniref:Taurine dioxygenase n=1 Tax=Parasphingorhabdus marina DSM 22363 TaxID=1123272 RepID=A0A1N6CNB7_9SPHN|nr:TauD/TfdA family dioxygenase [Parasphingorhabdus marina]SIN59996.1 taurine dioxygenase [Parasphingorhabdus marina DSM 22363]
MATATSAPQAECGLEIRQMTPGIGAEISGISLADPLDETVISAVRQALLTHKVIFFRDQHLSQEQLLAFARRFGELEIHPATPRDQPFPEVLRIAHGPDSRGKENMWHSDVTWRPEPSLGSVLSAVEIPPVGGDTLFANMNLAYEKLPKDLRERVTGLTAVHDIARVFAKRLGKSPEDLHDKYPPQEHPVIRTHPETGLRAIYVNNAFTSHIVGMDRAESDALLARLYATASDPEIQCRFRWAEGAVAFWDNRASQHFAASDYFPQRRVMERATIAGDRPYFDASA